MNTSDIRGALEGALRRVRAHAPGARQELLRLAQTLLEEARRAEPNRRPELVRLGRELVALAERVRDRVLPATPVPVSDRREATAPPPRPLTAFDELILNS